MNKSFFYFLVFTISFFIHTAAVSAAYLSIPAAALIPKDEGVPYSTNGGYMATDYSQAAVFYAPVFLPDNALIKNITLEANDNSGGESGGYVRINLVNYSYDSYSILQTVQTGGTNVPIEGNVQVSDAVDVSVDNLQYSYGIDVILHNGSAGAWSVMYYKCIIEYEDRKWDADGDNAVSLPDAINALQVVAGN